MLSAYIYKSNILWENFPIVLLQSQVCTWGWGILHYCHEVDRPFFIPFAKSLGHGRDIRVRMYHAFERDPTNWWCVVEAEDKNIHRNVQSFALLDIIPVRNIDNKFVGASPRKLVLQFSYIYMPQDRGHQLNWFRVWGLGFRGSDPSRQERIAACKCLPLIHPT